MSILNGDLLKKMLQKKNHRFIHIALLDAVIDVTRIKSVLLTHFSLRFVK
jgi:hypothetical protein